MQTDVCVLPQTLHSSHNGPRLYTRIYTKALLCDGTSGIGLCHCGFRSISRFVESFVNFLDNSDSSIGSAVTPALKSAISRSRDDLPARPPSVHRHSIRIRDSHSASIFPCESSLIFIFNLPRTSHDHCSFRYGHGEAYLLATIILKSGASYRREQRIVQWLISSTAVCCDAKRRRARRSDRLRLEAYVYGGNAQPKFRYAMSV